jgi:hypothetical membrane protein
MYLTRAGIVMFSAAALAGPWYTADGYNVVSNLVSELAAQRTKNNFVMVAGFLSLGLALIADGLRRFQAPAIPFMAFGLFMALAGLFGHKPMTPSLPYSELTHTAHSILASLAGISITVALVWHAARAEPRWRRVVALTLAILCMALPLAMLGLPEFQGLIQRLMYLLVFLWLWRFYPGLDTGSLSLDRQSR